ncbi:MAG TPA: N-acetylneuraminate synthase [Elusimicrobiota bacterium]|nr:N-acetylneuraminate synthase [Elusimicrobiota bacterium]
MSTVNTYRVANHILGVGHPVFIVAEMGINHNGDMTLAHKMIDAAARCGVDAVKFQTFSTERLVSRIAQKAPYQKMNVKGGTDQYGWLKPLEMDRENHFRLQDYAQKKGLVFFSTPFDEGCVPLLEELKVPVYKIASGNVTDFPLLKQVGKTRKPVILSTGMSTLQEIREAVSTLKRSGTNQIILLHCTSNYPIAIEDTHLRMIATLQNTFKLPVGFSDHNTSNWASWASIPLGVCLIERHFTLNCNLPGADHKASLTPDMMEQLVLGVRQIEKALGHPRKTVLPTERAIKKALQKSIVAGRTISKGEILDESNLTVKRPGTGLHPKYIKKLVGKRAKCTISEDSLISLNMVN